MHIIHFTEKAADPLFGKGSIGGRYVPLLNTYRYAQVGCLHLQLE